jgi:signal transduction histidine kinase
MVLGFILSLNKRFAEIAKVAERLARGEHDARAQVPGSDALGKLAATLNLLAERFDHDIAELKRLEQVRRDFVANVSHELRTPLASIKAFAETLGAGGVGEKDRAEFVAEIEKAADRMTKLVDDILNIAALESGKMPPKFEPLELLKVVAETAAALKPLAGKKDIVLRVEPFGDLPKVRADRAQLKQVVTNLVDNAVKYTQAGGLVRIFASGHDGGVELAVEDNGPGIPAEDVPRLQGARARARRQRPGPLHRQAHRRAARRLRFRRERPRARLDVPRASARHLTPCPCHARVTRGLPPCYSPRPKPVLPWLQ